MIELVDPFFPAIIAVGCFSLVVGACGFWLGSGYGRKKANRNVEKRIQDAFYDGHKQGVREASTEVLDLSKWVPVKRDEHGRFTS